MAELRSQTWVSKHPVAMFYILAFGISWLGFVPLLAGLGGFWKVALVLPGGGPAVAALIARRLAGESGVGGSGWRTEGRWYVLAAALPLALVLAANWLAPDRAPIVSPTAGAELAWFLLMSLAANPWEEVGWRGFATRRLQQRFSPLAVAAIVGVLWGLWHLPFFFWRESPMSGFPFWDWLAALLGETVILAWLYNSAGQSLAIAIVFHVMFNVWPALFGVRSHAALALANWAVALVLVWRFGTRLGLRPGERPESARD